jgi:phage head maturation protease
MTTTDEGYRSVPGTVIDLDESRHQALVELPHDVVDGFGTSWDPGCFRASLERRLPPVLREHLPSQHIGEVRGAQSLPRTTQLVAQFDDTPLAEASFRDIQSGKLKGWSFHFKHGVHAPHRSVRGARRYMRADMEELSAVSSPAIPGTRTLQLRSQPDALTRLLEVKAHMERVSGHRSLLVPNRYKDPLEYIDSVLARANAKLDEAVEDDYLVHEEMRDGLRPKTPEFRFAEIGWRYNPSNPHSPLNRHRR